jgi:hypothetical protein
MTRLCLVAFLSAVAGCASNKAANEPGTRIRADTTNPNDTLPRIRDSVPDSTRAR